MSSVAAVACPSKLWDSSRRLENAPDADACAGWRVGGTACLDADTVSLWVRVRVRVP